MRFLTYILVGIGALIAVVAIAVFVLDSGEQEAVAPQNDAEVIAGSELETAVSSEEGTVDQGVVRNDEDGAPTQAQVSLSDQETTRETTLKIDLAQVKPDGDAVFAGSAGASAQITVFEGDVLLGRTVADENGEWVVVLDKRLGAGEHLVSVGATDPDGTSELADVTLAISVAEAQDERPLVALLPQTETEMPTLLQSPDDKAVSVEVVDKASDTTGNVGVDDRMPNNLSPSVAPRSLVWQGADALTISGVSRGGAMVKARSNGTDFGAAEVTAAGEWQITGKVDITRASRTMRFELSTEAGDVVASYELPVRSRDLSQGLDGSRLVVVQRGDALWRIAYQTYGEGIKYVDIVRRNAAAIGDPDLIFPNQIFAIPE